MTTVSFKTFEVEVKRTVLLIQNELRKLENGSRFTVNVEAEGRIEGDVKIAYRVALDYESGVTGNEMQSVLVECMRRKGWNDTHAPKAISHVTGEVSDEI